MKKVIVMIFLCVLALQGCTGLIVSRADAPSETILGEAKVIKADKPYETKAELIPARLEYATGFPGGSYKQLRLGGAPHSPVSKNTVKKLQEAAAKESLVIFINRGRLVIETQGGNGKWYRGWVPPETVFLAKMTVNPADGTIDYEPVRLGLCWNPVRGIKLRQYPVIQREVVRYRDATERVVTERYRDIDYTPAIWTGLVGFGLGWILHPAGNVTQAVCPGGACGPGAPVPRPLP